MQKGRKDRLSGVVDQISPIKVCSRNLIELNLILFVSMKSLNLNSRSLSFRIDPKAHIARSAHSVKCILSNIDIHMVASLSFVPTAHLSSWQSEEV